MLFKRKLVDGRASAPEPPRTLQERLEASRPADDGGRIQSFIDASLSIVGDLHTKGDIRLDGRVCGNVTCAQLIVGRDAAITGAVTAEEAIVRGRITGTIRARLVILQDTAQVDSEITYSLLAIDDGAIFEGVAHRSENPLAEEAVSPLGDLRRLLAETPCASATGGAEPNRRDAGAQTTAVTSPVVADVRGVPNGHAEAQHKPSEPGA